MIHPRGRNGRSACESSLSRSRWGRLFGEEKKSDVGNPRDKEDTMTFSTAKGRRISINLFHRSCRSRTRCNSSRPELNPKHPRLVDSSPSIVHKIPCGCGRRLFMEAMGTSALFPALSPCACSSPLIPESSKVGEALPLADASVDAVIGTLVLCSVNDVNMTLEEIKRVLRPGGFYLFLEHVGAKGTPELPCTMSISSLYPRKLRVVFEYNEYQLAISKKALFSNTMVALPTGLGKTLIAAVVW